MTGEQPCLGAERLRESPRAHVRSTESDPRLRTKWTLKRSNANDSYKLHTETGWARFVGEVCGGFKDTLPCPPLTDAYNKPLVTAGKGSAFQTKAPRATTATFLTGGSVLAEGRLRYP